MDVAELRHLRRARDMMDREYARPLDVAALARVAAMSSGHFSRQFRTAFGETPAPQSESVRNEEAQAGGLAVVPRHGPQTLALLHNRR